MTVAVPPLPGACDFPWLWAAHPLAHLNAALNALALVLLVVGYRLIRGRRETAHKRVMLTAFAASVAFLISYLAYHVWPVGAKAMPFPGPPTIRAYVYLPILATHVVLAAVVPPLALATIYLALRDRRTAHLRLARVTFPIWLYVSVTGVLVYGMLYWIW